MTGNSHLIGLPAGRTAMVLAVTVTLSILVSIIIPSNKAISLCPDDSLFYTRIAQNLAQGHGYTFDRISPTTGFQPLWLHVQAALFLVVSLLTGTGTISNPQFLLRSSFFLTVFIRMVTASWIFMRYRTTGRGRISWSLAAVAYLILSMTWDFMMETDLLLLLFLFAYDGYLKDGRGAWVYPLFALCVFTRVDFSAALLILAVLSVAAGWRGGRTRSLRGPLLLAVSSLAGAAAVLLLSKIISGHAMPVSVILKVRGVALTSLSRDVPGLFFIPALSVPLMVSLILGTLAFAVRPDARRIVLRRFLPLPGMVILAVMQYVGSSLWGWHYYIPLIGYSVYFFGSSLSLLEEKCSGAGRVSLFRWLVILLVSPFLWLPFSTFLKSLDSERPPEFMYFAMEIARILPSESTVFSTDRAGALAVFGQVRVVNGDGLVNSYEYVTEYLLRGKVDEFIEEKDIEYIVPWTIGAADFSAGPQAGPLVYEISPWFLDVPSSYVSLSRDSLVLEYDSPYLGSCYLFSL